MDNALGVLRYNEGANAYWLRGSFLEKFYTVGLTRKMSDMTTISSELIFDGKNDPKKMPGLFGQPLFWRLGSTINMANNVKANFALFAKQKSLLYHYAMTMPLDSKTTLTSKAQLDVAALLTDPSKIGHKMGFQVDYKI